MAKSSTSFPKGKSGNPKGRPKKGETLADMFRDAMQEAKSEANPDYTKLHAMIDKVVQKALAGDQQALEYALARGYGKLIDRVEAVNLNKNYDFSNLPIEERVKLLELLKQGNGTTVHNDNPDSQ